MITLLLSMLATAASHSDGYYRTTGALIGAAGFTCALIPPIIEESRWGSSLALGSTPSAILLFGLPLPSAALCGAGLGAVLYDDPFLLVLRDSAIGTVLGAGVGAGILLGGAGLYAVGPRATALPVLVGAVGGVAGYVAMHGYMVAHRAHTREHEGWAYAPMLSPGVTGLQVHRRF